MHLSFADNNLFSIHFRLTEIVIEHGKSTNILSMNVDILARISILAEFRKKGNNELFNNFTTFVCSILR